MQSSRDTDIKIETSPTHGLSNTEEYTSSATNAADEDRQSQDSIGSDIKLEHQLLLEDIDFDEHDIELLRDQEQQTMQYPRFSEIQKSIEILKAQFPNTFQDILIDSIYQLAAFKYTEEKERQRHERLMRLQRQSIIDLENKGQQIIYIDAENESVYSKLMENDYQRDGNLPKGRQKSVSQINKQQRSEQVHRNELTYQLKRIVANTFCFKQVNYQFFKQQLGRSGYVVSVPKEQYLSLLDSVMREAYYNLQRKVRQEYKMKVNPLTKAEINLLVELYCKCTISLSKQLCDIIYKLIKEQFRIGKVNIIQQQGRKLYRATVRSVRDTQTCLLLSNNFADPVQTSKKAGVKKPMDLRTKKAKLFGLDYLTDPRKKRVVHMLDKKWNSQLENQLISLYKEKYQFSYIRDYFKARYPADSQMFEVVPVRSKLFKIERTAIRKLTYFIANFGQNLPQLINLDDERIKNILYTQTALDLRIMLLQVYSRTSYDERLIKQTIININDYFSKIEDPTKPRLQSPTHRGDIRDIRSKVAKPNHRSKHSNGNQSSKAEKRTKAKVESIKS